MKYVVYFETPVPGQDHPVRTYLQEAGSIGLNAATSGIGGSMERQMCTLDSRVLQLDTPKQAHTLAKDFGDAYTVYQGVYTLGYHGITENGNACAPFVTVIRGDANHESDVSRRYKHHIAMSEAYEHVLLPRLITRATVHVGRECDFTHDELMETMQYILENLVEEELDQVLGAIDSMARMGFRITGWDTYPESINIHYTRDGDTPHHSSVTINALNLWDEKGIKALVDQAARRKELVGVEDAGAK